MKKFAALMLLSLFISSTALAKTGYVLVKSELNVRAKPSLGSNIYGRLFTGDTVEIKRTYHGWLYLEGLHSEEGTGWISEQYVVYEPVKQLDGVRAIVAANGRVAVRNCVGGKRTSWAHPDDVLMVYATSESWSVTDRGYIRTEYLVFK